MADIGDLAQEREEAEREAALSAFRFHRRQDGMSATHCKSCGEPIPEARRQAVSTDHCAFCAGQIEREK